MYKHLHTFPLAAIRLNLIIETTFLSVLYSYSTKVSYICNYFTVLV